MTNDNKSTNLMTASTQWATRPNDERFTNIDDLQAFTLRQKGLSRTADVTLKNIELSDENGAVVVSGSGIKAVPTHWGFGQLCSTIGAPASYLRTLPAKTAVECLQHGMEKKSEQTEAFRWLMRDRADGSGSDLAAVTSVNYGRIWNGDAVTSLKGLTARLGDRFFNPPARDPATGKMAPGGLYASDRDFFAFFIDGGSVAYPTFDDGKSAINRGFFVWNSEVGAASFGVTSFLFRETCSNHIVWGAESTKELRIRHNRLAPERFIDEAMPQLEAFTGVAAMDEAAKAIKAAQAAVMPNKVEDAIEFLRKRGFTGGEAKASLTIAEIEEGGRGSVWQAIQGLTSYAKTFGHIDARVDLERRAGNLLSYVSA